MGTVSHTQQGVSEMISHEDHTRLGTCTHCSIRHALFQHISHRAICIMWNSQISVWLMCGLAVQELKRLIDVACQRRNSRVLMRCVYNIGLCCHKIERMALHLWQSDLSLFSVWDLHSGKKQTTGICISLERTCCNLYLFVPVISPPVTAVLTCNNSAISHSWWQWSTLKLAQCKTHFPSPLSLSHCPPTIDELTWHAADPRRGKPLCSHHPPLPLWYL